MDLLLVRLWLFPPISLRFLAAVRLITSQSGLSDIIEPHFEPQRPTRFYAANTGGNYDPPFPSSHSQYRCTDLTSIPWKNPADFNDHLSSLAGDLLVGARVASWSPMLRLPAG